MRGGRAEGATRCGGLGSGVVAMPVGRSSWHSKRGRESNRLPMHMRYVHYGDTIETPEQIARMCANAVITSTAVTWYRLAAHLVPVVSKCTAVGAVAWAGESGETGVTRASASPKVVSGVGPQDKRHCRRRIAQTSRVLDCLVGVARTQSPVCVDYFAWLRVVSGTVGGRIPGVRWSSAMQASRSQGGMLLSSRKWSGGRIMAVKG